MWREGRILDILLSRKKRSSFFGFWWAGEGKGWDALEKDLGEMEMEESTKETNRVY